MIGELLPFTVQLPVSIVMINSSRYHLNPSLSFLGERQESTRFIATKGKLNFPPLVSLLPSLRALRPAGLHLYAPYHRLA